MLPLIKEVLNARDELTKVADAFLNPDYKLIRIGMSPLIDTHLVANALEPFRRHYPGVDIVFKECLLDDLKQRLVNHTIDLTFLLSGDHASHQGRETFYRESLFFLPKEFEAGAARSTGPVMLHAIADGTIMVSKGCGLADGLHQLLQSQGLKMNEYPGQALSYRVLEEWAGLGIGAAILPQSKVSPDNQTACPLHLEKGQEAMFTYDAIWSEEVTHADHVTALIAHFKRTVPKLVGELAG